jgi:hypothetical protein
MHDVDEEPEVGSADEPKEARQTSHRSLATVLLYVVRLVLSLMAALAVVVTAANLLLAPNKHMALWLEIFLGLPTGLAVGLTVAGVMKLTNRWSPSGIAETWRRFQAKEVPAVVKENREPGMESGNARSSWSGSLSLLIGLFSVAFAAVRVLSAAGGDLETAYAILREQGTGTIYVGTLIYYVGVMAAPIALLCWIYYKNSGNWLALAVAGGCLYIVIVAAHISELVFGAFIAFVYSIAATSRGRSLRSVQTVTYPKLPWLPKGITIVIFVYSLGILGALIFNTAPWLPIQAISIEGQRPFSGYVLSEGNATSSILTAHPISVIYVQSKSIKAVKLCAQSEYLFGYATLMGIFEHFTHQVVTYPPCPSGSYDHKSLSSNARRSGNRYSFGPQW